MKRFICLIIAVLLFIFPLHIKGNSPQTVYASSTYARIITEDTPFYQTESDETPLFYLPYTYYVKVLSKTEKFSHVECYGEGNTPAIDGFVPTEALFFDDLTVENPFVVLDITTVNTAVLYKDASLSTQSQYVFSNRNLHYYGSFPHESGKVYFVSYNNKLGYVKESDVFPFSIPNHPNELTFIIPEEPEPPSKESTPSSDSFFGIKVAIIICLLFAGSIALFIALSKRPEKGVATGYYDENDYE